MITNRNLNLSDCRNLKSLGKLKEVEGDLDLWESYNLEDLGNLEYVSGTLDLRGCNNLKSLNKLKEVKGNLICHENLEDLGDLEYVGEYLDLINCDINSLGNLKEVRKIYILMSGITKEYVNENYPHLLDKCVL